MTGGNHGVGCWFLKRVDVFRVVLIVLMCIGVSRSKEIRDFFVVEALLFNFFYVGVFSSCVRIYMCSLVDSSEDNGLIDRSRSPHGYSPGK